MNFISGCVEFQSQPVALNGFAQTILNSTKGHGTVITGVIGGLRNHGTLNFFRGLTRIKKARPTRIGTFFYWGA